MVRNLSGFHAFPVVPDIPIGILIPRSQVTKVILMCMLASAPTFRIGLEVLLASWMQKGYTADRIDRARDYLEWRFRREHGYAY